MSLHSGVRQALADRLTALEPELRAAREAGLKATAEYKRAEAQYRQLHSEKTALLEMLREDDATKPAPRAEVHPEGVTPPPAERAQDTAT